MSGLIERLRELAEEWYECCDDIHEPLTEAADALEKLAGHTYHKGSCPWWDAERTDDCVCGLSALLAEVNGTDDA